MFKYPFILTILLLTTSFLAEQQLHSDDYKIYSVLIKTEIPDTTKSVVVLKTVIQSQEISDNTSTIVNDLKSNDLSSLYQVYGWTEADNGKRPTVLDSTTQQFIIDFCRNKFDNFWLTNEFDLSPKVFLINKLPIRQHSIGADWESFYNKFPGAGGIFAFSKIIYYSADKATAMCYYWHRKNGLNGHGALAIMTKINSEWKIKYKTYLWWN